MKKNDIVEVEIESYSSDGSGIARVDGYVLFVRGALRGERAAVRVLKVGKSYGFAKTERVTVPSPERVAPECPLHACGGCSLMHMSRAEELSFKRDKVLDALRRAGAGHTFEGITDSPRHTEYRNKAQYPVRAAKDGGIAVGFYRRGSHDVVEGGCAIQPAAFGAIARAVKDRMIKNGVSAYDEINNSGTVRHICLRSNGDLSQIMLCLVVCGSFDEKEAFAADMRKAFPQISTVVINYNDAVTNAVQGERYETVSGAGYIEDILCGKRFIISPQSFYQVNHDACEILYGIVREYAAVKDGERVLDLYCGIGTIGLCACGGGRLTGVEIVERAVEDARRNAEINGVFDAEFVACDAAKAVPAARPGVIIVDPPRKGCDIRTLELIANSGADRLVYVSCDSATLSRDLVRLKELGFSAERSRAVNMFPRTEHVETVVRLSRQ